MWGPAQNTARDSEQHAGFACSYLVLGWGLDYTASCLTFHRPNRCSRCWEGVPGGEALPVLVPRQARFTTKDRITKRRVTKDRVTKTLLGPNLEGQNPRILFSSFSRCSAVMDQRLGHLAPFQVWAALLAIPQQTRWQP